MLFRRCSVVRSQNPMNCSQLGFEPLESRLLLAGDFQLFKDINATPAPVGIFGGIGVSSDSLVVGDTFFFTAIDAEHGQELWKSDGTEEGTVLVKDIRPGAETSSPSYFCELNGVLYFAANDGVTGSELWRSDGTEEGTFLVRDASPDALGLYPRNLHRVGGTLVFESGAGWEGDFLWKSDGTEAGTTNIPNTSRTIYWHNSTSVLFLDGGLWRTDGTEAGTFLLLSSMGDVEYVGTVGETMYFTRQTPGSLWKTDGTVAGTTQVGSINVDLSWSSELHGIAIGQTLFFSADDDVHGSELWKLDGTSGSLALVKDIRPGYYSESTYPFSSNPTDFVAMEGVAYFLVDGPSGQSFSELWKSDGTSEGTVLVKQFEVLDSTQGLGSLSSVDGTLYFSVRGETENALWKSDGTEAGTVKVKTINSGPFGLGHYRGSAGVAVKAGDAILLFADDEHFGPELWRTDGTEAGTGVVKDIRVATGDSNARQLTEAGVLTYFTANDGVHGEELWVSDGTPNGTRIVKDILPGIAGAVIDHLVNVDGTLYFTVGGDTASSGLWKTDGTEAGTIQVRGFASPKFSSGRGTFANVAGTLYFSIEPPNAGGAELWKSDGTEAGTALVKDLSSNWLNQPLLEMTAVGGTLFFSARSDAGRELWKSDGTLEGTVLVKNIASGYHEWFGPDSSDPSWLTEFQGQLYFSAYTPASGRELWRSDGTTAGTVQVKDIAPQSSSASPSHFVKHNGTLYFIASNSIWKSDGSGAGTVLIKDLYINGVSGYPHSMVNVGDRLYVVSGWPAEQAVLWSSDGTEAGTFPLAGDSPASQLSAPSNPIAWNGEVYFMARSNDTGLELWRSDGTIAGTVLAKDFDGYRSNSLDPASPMAVINGRLAVIAKTIHLGSELWISEPDAPSVPGDYDANGNVDGADFLAWQRGFGGAAAPAGLGADGDGSGAVDAGDLVVWAEHFGEGSASGAAAGLAAGVMAVEMAESELVAPVSLAAAEGVVLGEGVVAKPQAVSGRDSTAAGDLAGLAQREASGREALGGRAWCRAAVRLEEVAEASSRRRAVAASLDAAFASLGTSSRRGRWGGVIDADEIDDAAAGFNKVAKPRAGGVASIGVWGESGEGAPGR